MVGVTDGQQVITGTVDVSYFQEPAYTDKAYLREYANKGWGIVQSRFMATPETHRIEICTGYINTGLRDLLREHGFDVKVVEIKGLLQDKLEDLFRLYVKETLGEDLAYDPKVILSGKNSARNLSENYYKVLNWGRRNAPHMLKTGWKSLQ
jgi:hypothetical protein